jgi:hypothetical protein
MSLRAGAPFCAEAQAKGNTSNERILDLQNDWAKTANN